MQVPILDLAAQHAEIQAEVDAAIARITRSGAFVGGEEVAGFEREFATYLGATHVIGVANGTDALELALQAAGVGPGDTVATAAFTFAGTVEAIVRVGAHLLRRHQSRRFHPCRLWRRLPRPRRRDSCPPIRLCCEMERIAPPRPTAPL
jgi:hypothetical protein